MSTKYITIVLDNFDSQKMITVTTDRIKDNLFELHVINENYAPIVTWGSPEANKTTRIYIKSLIYEYTGFSDSRCMPVFYLKEIKSF